MLVPVQFMTIALVLCVQRTLAAAAKHNGIHPRCGLCTHPFDASFDDVASPPAGTGGIFNQTPPTPYMSLAYGEVVISSQALVGGILPHSKPNIAVHGAIVNGGSNVTLNAVYTASKVQSFDLSSFYFGCQTVNALQSNGALAVGCSLQVTGYKLNPQNPSVCDVIGPMLFSFVPNTLGGQILNVNLAQAKLDGSYAGLTNVTIALTNSEILARTTTIYFDNFVGATHEVCCPT